MSETKSNLAPYAVALASGRLHNESEDIHRNAFQRDVGRIIHSKAFRRLAFKTQVLSPIEGDHYRSRLSHTLECSQMARAIARGLKLNETLTEAIALAHDLGHPPFGHAGEGVLDKLMERFGGFDHNLQNIRIVAVLEEKSAFYPGLNLTYETLAGIAKSKRAKAFLSENFELSQEEIPVSCEAWVADLSDELAYTTHDFDDFVRYFDYGTDEIKALNLELVLDNMPCGVENGKIAHQMCVRNMVNQLVTDVIECSTERIKALNDEQKSDIGLVKKCIDLSDEKKAKLRQLEKYLYESMYRNVDVKTESRHGSEAIEELFGRLEREWELDENDNEGYLRLCDYIAGMTDRYLFQSLDINIEESAN